MQADPPPIIVGAKALDIAAARAFVDQVALDLEALEALLVTPEQIAAGKVVHRHARRGWRMLAARYGVAPADLRSGGQDKPPEDGEGQP